MGTAIAVDVSPGVLRELLAAHLQACEEELAQDVAVDEAGRRLEGARADFMREASIENRRRLQVAASEERLAIARRDFMARRRKSTWVAYAQAVLGR